MKIGIATFQRAHNYGALLQAYALLATLIRLGHQAHIIDYWPQYHRVDYPLFPCFRTGISFKSRIRLSVPSLFGASKYLLRFHRFRLFMKKMLGIPYLMPKSSLTFPDIQDDAIIFGSDQIWKYYKLSTFSGFDRFYFGTTISPPTRKIAYAASMGVIAIDSESSKWMHADLQSFKAISVRESNLAAALHPIGITNVATVLDPAFLLSKEDWEATCIIPKAPPFILLYQISLSETSSQIAEAISRRSNLEIRELRGVIFPYLRSKRYQQTAGPNEFLALVRDSEFIISTSFHGVVFSIIFNKQFVATGMGKNSSRVTSLLEKLGISERYVETSDSIDHLPPIDYGPVNAKLAQLRKESLDFLVSSLCDE